MKSTIISLSYRKIQTLKKKHDLRGLGLKHLRTVGGHNVGKGKHFDVRSGMFRPVARLVNLGAVRRLLWSRRIYTIIFAR